MRKPAELVPTTALVLPSALVALLAAACAPPAESATPDESAEAPPAAEVRRTAVVPGAPSDPPDDILAALLRRTPPDSATAAAAVELVQEAADAARDERYPEAILLYDSVAVLAPALEDWIPLFRAEVLAEAGDPDGVAETLEEIPEGIGLRERWGWTTEIRAREVAGDTLGAAALAARRAEETDDRGEAARAWSRAVGFYLAAGDTAQAAEVGFEALDGVPEAEPSGALAHRLHELPDLSDERNRMLGRVLLLHGRWEEAWERLEDEVDGDAPEPEDAARLRVDLARGLVHLDRHDDALALLEGRGLEDDPEVGPDALYWIGRALEGSGEEDAAQVVRRRLVDRHPESRAAGRALLAMAEKEVEEEREERALAWLETLAAHGHRTARSDLLLVRIGTERYREGAYEEAAAVFDRYREPGGADGEAGEPPERARYWKALALERAGQGVRARGILREIHDASPLGFYGIAAAERLDLPLLPADLPSGPSADAAGRLEGELANALLRLEVHRYVPTPGSLSFEVDRLTAHFRSLERGAEYALAETLIEGGLTIQGILLGRAIQRREGGWNVRLLRIVYPFPHRESVVRQAHRHELDPFLVAGLIRQESMFRTDIRSPAGAVGLMQLMPGTGQEVARSTGVSPFTTSRLTDPEVNLRLGTHFLRDMLDRFDDRVTDALAAYNAGPTRARRWRSMPQYPDVDVFVEHIPFRETRNYVKVVQQNSRIYAALYGCGDFGPCRGLSYAAWVERTRPWVTPARGVPAR